MPRVDRRPAVGERRASTPGIAASRASARSQNCRAVGLLWIEAARQRHAGGDDAPHVDADVDAVQPLQAHQHEHGGDDERRGERELGRDQRVAQPPRRRTVGRAATARSEVSIHAQPRAAQCRDESAEEDDEPARHREAGQPDQDRPVNRTSLMRGMNVAP